MKYRRYGDYLQVQEKKHNRKMNFLFGIFYCFMTVVALIGIYEFYIDRYTVYLTNEEVIVDKGSIYTVELLPEYDQYFNYENYIYTSENTNIAVVDKYGQITAVDNGETYIDVKFKHDYKSKKLKVKVENMNIKSIDVAKSFKINKNDTQKIKVNINNQENIGASLNYKIQDNDIAKVDLYGNVTGLKKGTTTLVVSALNGLSKEVKLVVEEKKVEIQEIEIDEKLVTLNVGDEKKLRFETVPSNADTSSLIWKSEC